MTEPERGRNSKSNAPCTTEARRGGGGRALVVMICGSLVYYHCAYRNSSIVSLISDVFIVLLCSLAILGLLFRHIRIEVPVDPLEWQISQDTANSMFAWLANTIGAAESVLRVAATGHDKRLFLKVVASLYLLSAVGRLVSGVTVAYTAAFIPLLCIPICVKLESPWFGQPTKMEGALVAPGGVTEELPLPSPSCWIVLVLSLRSGRELRFEQFMHAMVPEEERPCGGCAG